MLFYYGNSSSCSSSISINKPSSDSLDITMHLFNTLLGGESGGRVVGGKNETTPRIVPKLRKGRHLSSFDY